MAHPFELTYEIEVGASPEQVWDAISTGPGLNSWFMGRSTIEPRVGGTLTMETDAWKEASTITAWEPPTHFASRTSEGPDGAFHVFDYRVEHREPVTRVRWNHSGALGPNWEAEYEGMSEGDPMYFNKLGEYLTYFLGRTGVPIEAWGPNLGAGPTWEVFREPLGLAPDAHATLDAPIRLTPDGLDAIEGVVDHVSKSFLGVRSADAMYRFIVGWEGTVVLGHHLFAEGVDRDATQDAWQGWITRAFS